MRESNTDVHYTKPGYAELAKSPFREFAQPQIAADQVMAGKVSDPTGGATHYYATPCQNHHKNHERCE